MKIEAIVSTIIASESIDLIGTEAEPALSRLLFLPVVSSNCGTEI